MHITDIYEIFAAYFGTNKVDLQSYGSTDIHFPSYLCSEYSLSDHIIIVHWPTVTVANEYDSNIDIWDLYAFTVITEEGKLRGQPLFLRGTYDRVQWGSDYLHSHVSSINKNNVAELHSSCLGSGPIRSTIVGLMANTYNDPDMWNLYCWELDKYVAVESISGTPYHRLSEVGVSNHDGNAYKSFSISPKCGNTYKQTYHLLSSLIPYLLKNNILKYAYYDGRYRLASSFADTVLNISDSFITLYNSSNDLRKYISIEHLYKLNFLVKMRCIDGVFYYNNGGRNMPLEALVGTRLFTFCGKEVKLSIKNEDRTYDNNELIIIDPLIMDYIVYLILKYVNFKYGHETNTTNKRCKVI